jgi:hypothetical protein
MKLKAQLFKIARQPLFWVYVVMCRFFCSHLKWVKTGNTMGYLYEHKCKNCGKKIHSGVLDPPISFVS